MKLTYKYIFGAIDVTLISFGYHSQNNVLLGIFIGLALIDLIGVIREDLEK